MTIYSLQTLDPNTTVLPYWKNVPFVANKPTIEFKPGLNIVFGPNGSGKTTLIKTLAIVLHCFQGGFQKVTQTSISALNLEATSETLPTVQKAIYDGAEVRYVSADKDIGNAAAFDDDFLLDDLSARMTPGSAGQKVYQKINRILGEKPKKVEFAVNKNRVNSLWKQWIEIAEDQLKANPIETIPKKPTFIFDEPDRSLDFARQVELWDFIRKYAASQIQVIVASHSPLALGLPEATYLETVPNAIETLTDALRSAGWTRASAV